jgi:hypothetical protein
MNAKNISLILLGFVLGYLVRMFVKSDDHDAAEEVGEKHEMMQMAYSVAPPDTTLSNLITWTEADTLVSRFHRSKYDLYGMFPEGYSATQGEKPPKLLSWFVNRESIEYCMRDRDSITASGIRVYPILKKAKDASNRDYYYHSLVIVGTKADVKDSITIHNNIKDIYAADHMMPCPTACLDDIFSSLGEN